MRRQGENGHYIGIKYFYSPDDCMQLQKTKKGNRHPKRRDRENERLKKHWTLYPRADENIHGAFASGMMLSEGLDSDHLIPLLEFLSHTGVSQVPAVLHALTN